MNLGAWWVGVTLLQAPAVLPRTHSHNDYLRARPLADALENGLASVEVDLYLVDGKLLVAHDRKDVRSDRTLESIYLQPLVERLHKNRGRIYPGHAAWLWVLVDLKSDGLQAYEAFKKSISRFPELDYRGKNSAVRFVISGDRPIEAILRDRGKFAGLDGRWPDLGKNYSEELMPWISEAWLDHFRWIGARDFSGEDRIKLGDMVSKVHREGRRLRFWGAPDLAAIWEVQWTAGVDFLNTDQPKLLREWIEAHP